MPKLITMKKLCIAAFLFAALAVNAQEKARQTLTPEQRTELQVKKMTLDLDLNEKQQKELSAVMLDQNKRLEQQRVARANQKADLEKLSKEERFKRKNEALDEQIAFKKKMKEILNAEQFSKWEANRERRKDIVKSHVKTRNEQRLEQKAKK